MIRIWIAAWMACMVSLLGYCVARAAPGAPVPWTGGSGGIIFVVDGAGGKDMLTSNLSWLAAERTPCLRVLPFLWASVESNGDIRRQERHFAYGYRLARAVMSVRQSCPGKKVYIVGYGGGASVCLAAMEFLPPSSVDRMFLLGPRVSSCFDLRRALSVTCEGIDAFHCPGDSFLDDTSRRFGNGDGTLGAPAGLVGFRPILATPEDRALYSKLRQQGLDISHPEFGSAFVVECAIINRLR
jgi:hypothetical protein